MTVRNRFRVQSTNTGADVFVSVFIRNVGCQITSEGFTERVGFKEIFQSGTPVKTEEGKLDTGNF